MRRRLSQAAATRHKGATPPAGELPRTSAHSHQYSASVVALRFPEAVHLLLLSYVDSSSLNQAMSAVKRYYLCARDVPDARGQFLRDLKMACVNMYGEDWHKMAFTQGLPKHLHVDD